MGRIQPICSHLLPNHGKLMKAMIYPEELRIGNKLNYYIDEIGGYEETTIDWQDLKWISEDIVGFNDKHKGIRLTEDLLLSNGFYRSMWGNSLLFDINLEDKGNYIYFSKDLKVLYIVSTDSKGEQTATDVDCQYFHTLQNIVLSLTGDILLG